MVVGSNPVAATETSDIAFVSSKKFLDIHATAECRFARKMRMWHDKNTKRPCHPCYIFSTFTGIHFMSTFFARGKSLVATEFHAPLTIWSGLRPNYLVD